MSSQKLTAIQPAVENGKYNINLLEKLHDSAFPATLNEPKGSLYQPAKRSSADWCQIWREGVSKNKGRGKGKNGWS